ncbi:Class III cytochrome C family protein [Candidatus Methylomirabilis lanthanidiphila]|uniref:Class III cytochrome C family protein n=1 Tax=Candidatus Methylomirabilis lanthanidiphila TaxID=2211376 RepID=A0A564ZKI4_9BACT|nr:cytochrome c3 family protein [Candidatus Methylomirabilis lanthanidiphila]VUZ85152.1 Class III cytochrome C family protein [Candidatus Methylomirabilis lanthanidiphila]
MGRMIRRGTTLALACLLIVSFTPIRSLAQAKPKIPPPFAFEQKTTDEQGNRSPGKVTFNHKTHIEKGQKCLNCHGKGKPFKTKIGTSPDLTMKAYDEGKACGTCHNGKIAFSTKEKDSCLKCHKVPSSS